MEKNEGRTGEAMDYRVIAAEKGIGESRLCDESKREENQMSVFKFFDLLRKYCQIRTGANKQYECRESGCPMWEFCYSSPDGVTEEMLESIIDFLASSGKPFRSNTST